MVDLVLAVLQILALLDHLLGGFLPPLLSFGIFLLPRPLARVGLSVGLCSLEPREPLLGSLIFSLVPQTSSVLLLLCLGHRSIADGLRHEPLRVVLNCNYCKF